MAFDDDFARALKETDVRRERRSRLLTVGSTQLPYVLLSASVVNTGDTAVRRGTVKVESPSLFLLNRPLQFEGFEEDGGDTLVAMGRVARFPPGRYSNIDTQLDIFEGSVEQALAHYQDRLDAEEDLHTGVVIGPPDLWAMSLLVYIGKMVQQSAHSDLESIMTRPRLPRHWS